MEHFLKTTVTIELLIYVLGACFGAFLALWKWYDSRVIQKGFTTLEDKITEIKDTLEENRAVHVNSFDKFGAKMDESFERIMTKLDENHQEFVDYRDQTAKNIAQFWKEYAPALEQVRVQMQKDPQKRSPRK